ncbi:CAP domain-containing protein [Halorussus caseinilyticus]|uniref:CAP domain-containing protein n=1 Tax=Halorussus caseinilyticus TaxID=3034025 RepID=A0ABD5WP66_9EURY|nr:CAP domain-containing protein [Halorussus sp. DT72]
MNRRAFLATACSGAVAGCSGRLLGPKLDRTAIADHLRDYVNEARTDRGVGYFATDEKLVKVARYHAEDMLDDSYLRMTSPDGETLADRYRKFDYSCGGVPADSDGPRVGNAVLFKIGFDSGSYTEAEVARRLFDRLLASPEKKELAFWDVWDAQGTGAAVGTDAGGRTLVYAAQCYC